MTAPPGLETLAHAGAARAAGAPALIWRQQVLTYGELAAATDRVARSLERQGLGAGRRVGLCLANSPQWVMATLGAWRAGAGVVDVPASTPAAARTAALERFGACAWVDAAAFAGGRFRGAHRTRPAPPHADDAGLACINLTSGSTGTPRGVLLGHDNLLRNAALYVDHFGLDEPDRTALVLPLSFGMNKIALLAHLLIGATVVLERDFRVPNAALAAMQAARATGLVAVPAVVQSLLARGDLGRFPVRSLRYVRIGAGHLPHRIMAELGARWPGARRYLTYGLTEVGLVTVLEGEEHARRPGSCGRPVRGVELSLGGERAAADGEIVVRCAHAARGYCADPGATRAVFRPGGVHTGDRGRVDAAGYLYLTGRDKDIIKSGGESVAAAEVEQVLLAHDGVAECAVIGVPDEWLGEAVEAHVVLHAHAGADAAALRAFCNARLAPVKRPRRIVLHEALPRGETGKVRKAALGRGAGTR